MADGCTLLILAGGRSRRMGKDKATLTVGEATLVEHLASRLNRVVDETLVAAGQRGDPIGNLRLVLDHFTGMGPLAGMHAGCLAARQPLVWVVACDLPDVEPGLGGLLRSVVGGADAAVPRVVDDPEGVCAVYRASVVAPAIDELLRAGRRSVKALLDRLSVRYVGPDELRSVDPGLRSFRNLNTPAEYAAWLKSR